uniref:Uncharacterized protein n=1 Tax=Arundo donax TaxID=35708 RepID=A0A0A9E658_ARUDO
MVAQSRTRQESEDDLTTDQGVRGGASQSATPNHPIQAQAARRACVCMPQEWKIYDACPRAW